MRAETSGRDATAAVIGRFALTPLLPAMAGVSLAQGSALAAANYAGYLAGSIACGFVRVPPGNLAKWGLAGVAVSTLLMGLTAGFATWLAWRFVAGAASALVLIGTAAWALRKLAECDRARWAGGVFSGVGVGIALAGALVLAVLALHGDAREGWLTRGVAASVVAARAWRPLSSSSAVAAASQEKTGPLDGKAWMLVVCYSAFGLGYIVPATYLPLLAKRVLDDPAQIGLVWPVFGLAAACSTLVVSYLGSQPRRAWAAAHAVMALGVAAATFGTGGAMLVVGAVCVGSTFMVVTMTGLQEARRVGGASGTRLMAAMTSAFAAGQLAGPLLVIGLADRPQAFAVAGGIAAAFLVASAVALAVTSTR
jgi:MFS family permease